MVRMRKLRGVPKAKPAGVVASVAVALALAMTAGAFQGPLKRALDRAQEAKAAENAHTATVNAAEKQLSSQPAAKSKQPGAQPASRSRGTSQGGATAQRRDPFVAPPRPVDPNVPPSILPPGKRGLIISQANLQGVAKTAGGMIAVVTAPNGRTFFLHPNDPVFNGRVARITEDSVVFEETVLDSHGRKMQREVIKQLPAEK